MDPNYPSAPSAETSASPAPEMPAEGGDQEERAEGETFLIPKSALKGDYKVGDTCTFKIVHGYSDEFEVLPVDAASNKEESMEGAQAQLDEMAVPEES